MSPFPFPIGGTTSNARNVISGNTGFGISVAAAGNTIQGNYIGVDAAGTANLGNSSYGISISSSGNLIGGTAAGARNVVSGNSAYGLVITGASATGNTVQGNYIGTDLTGEAKLGNTNAGVYVGGANNTIGGTTSNARNVISGNTGYGISVAASGTIIQGNYIGVDAAGTAKLGNSSYGMLITSSGNTIGGTTAGAGNVVSGNSSYGLFITGASATGNTVQGNYIGTDYTGEAKVGNTNAGIYVGGANNTIGGATSNARNVISGNTGYGISVAASGTIIQGNYIGVDAAGTAKLGNSSYGILITSSGNSIGGTAAGAGNVVSGNSSYGLGIIGAGATGNAVQGNYIGTNATGTALGNSSGIYISGSGNTIGGTAAAMANVIAFNTAYGVQVQSGNQNAIETNSIYANGSGSIQLVSGGNSSQAAPVLTSASSASGIVAGSLTSAANTTYRVEFFLSPAAGQAKTFLTFKLVTTDATGKFNFSFALPGLVAGQYVTATATDPLGNTSALCVSRLVS